MVHRLREALPLSLSSQHIEDLLISGLFYAPCDFPTTAPSVVEKKIKTAPTKRILIALLALSSFILRDETDGKKILFFFRSRITRRTSRVSTSTFCCYTNVYWCGSSLSNGPNPAFIQDMMTATRLQRGRLQAILSVSADLASSE